MAPFMGPADAGRDFIRYSDAQLYALARYLYSLEPPPNPNPRDAEARRGEAVFERAGCNGCHPAPLYTNNRLLPAPGFEVPEGAERVDAILPVGIGTDPTLATETRRGTGYYKVPSLRGVWLRDVFGHGGQAASLEEWLDPRRLDDDYVPRGTHMDPGPIRGHTFGLSLSEEDRRALIAFLKTL
jgi:cytochrome c2